MAKKTDIPKFGVLSGIRIVHATTSVAGPFGAEMLAEMGADVIWVENHLSPDVSRLSSPVSDGIAAESERRNQRSISLNMSSPEGKKVLFGLIKNADVFFEASKGGQYANWGVTDEVLWEVNPKLVIAHLSGFGQTGDPSFVPRGCWDPIAQAFTGYMALQGFPDKDPNPAHQTPTDYSAGLVSALAILAALNHAQKTGIGESIDVAQYEVALRCQSWLLPDYLNCKVLPTREGSKNRAVAGWGVYKCKDDVYIYLIILGPTIVRKAVEILELGYGTEDFPENMGGVGRGTRAADRMEQKIEEYCSRYTAKEMEEIFWPKGVPCCRIMQYSDLVDHPHYVARGSFVEWEAVDGSAYEGQKLKGPAFPVRFKKNPSQIWRGCPTVGMDNEDILQEAGFTPEEISDLYKKKVIYKAPPKAKRELKS